MKFAPKSEEEVSAGNLLPKGEYDFEVAAADDATSKAGNEMIKLTVKVFAPDGSYIIVFDYLLESVAYKLRHAALSCGLGAAYEAGNLAGQDFEGRAGRCKVKVDKQEGYADKNAITDYIVPKASIVPIATQTLQTTAVEIDDDIPF